MKQQLTLFLAFIAQLTYSQDILWEKSLGGKHADYLMDVIATSDYGFLIGGSSISQKSGNKSALNKGGYDYCIWKISESGEIDWQKSFGGSGNDMLQSVKPTRDGGYILAGISDSQKGNDKKEDCIGQNDIWVIKLNAKGQEIWQKTIGGVAEEQLASIIQTKDNGFLICGNSESDKVYSKTINNNLIFKNESSKGGMDFWVIKLDDQGKFIWQKTIGGDAQDQIRSVVQTNDGGYIITGVTNSQNNNLKLSPNNGAYDIWYLKLDTKGDVVWQNVYGSDGDENVYTVLQKNDGKLIIAANTNSKKTPYGNSTNGSDFVLLNLEPDGAIISEKIYSIGKDDILTNLIQNKDETLLLCGYIRNDETPDNSKKVKKHYKEKALDGKEDYFVLKLDKEGEMMWDKSLGTNGRDILSKAIETRDGGYVLAGTSDAFFNKRIIEKNNILGSKLLSDTGFEQLNTVKDVNDDINNEKNKIIIKANNLIGKSGDSPLQLKSDKLDLLDNPISNNNSQSKNENKLPSTGDKENNFGYPDFWIVKLRDNSKPKKVKEVIEALPNPSTGLTSIIVGYDFESGTATLVDISGRQLQQFEISDRIVPIDLTQYPEGIYIVNIKTNKQTDGIKIIKGISKK